MTERKSIKNYNKSLDQKINETLGQLKNSKSVYGKNPNSVAFNNLYNL